MQALTRDVLHATHLLGRNGSFVFALSGIEIALWDLWGKRTGQPLHRLLGGGRASDVECYASLLNYTDLGLVAKNTSEACALATALTRGGLGRGGCPGPRHLELAI